jgi:DNA repair ATPase RecN
MIRVERMRLSELTNSAKAFNTDSLQIFDGIKSEIDMLKQRIEIIQKLDIVTQLFQSMAGKAFDAPAKRMYDVNKLLSQATDNLKLPNPEMVNLTVAKENIQQADEKLRNLTKEDPLFSKELAGLVSKLAEIYAEIDLKGTKLEELKEKLKDLLSLLDKENVERYTVETNILPEHYHWLSSSIERLFVLRHYIHIWNMYIDRREIIILSEPDLINSLEKRTWHALQDARQYRFQFKENVYTTQIKDAKRKGMSRNYV